jgi:uncharacterized Ntn-hydrolase superfamily protein
VAVQSKAFAVGSAVAWAEAGVGAVATQAQTNEAFGPRGLALLEAGLTSDQVLDILLGSDDGREHRQVAVMDARGVAVNFTGGQCLDWAGGVTGPNFACQGNILASGAVVDGMAEAFETAAGPLAERLLEALVAGQAAGGDKRGVQSAALLVVRPSTVYPQYRHRYIDLRVEDHTDPIAELVRLYRMWEKTDLVQAYARFAEQYEAEGRTGLAALEREKIGMLLARSLEEEDRDPDQLNNLAWYCATNDIFLEQALEAATLAVAMRPEDANILDTLAEVYFRLDMVDEAVSTIERAIAIDPASSYYREQLRRFRKVR